MLNAIEETKKHDSGFDHSLPVIHSLAIRAMHLVEILQHAKNKEKYLALFEFSKFCQECIEKEIAINQIENADIIRSETFKLFSCNIRRFDHQRRKFFRTNNTSPVNSSCPNNTIEIKKCFEKISKEMRQFYDKTTKFDSLSDPLKITRDQIPLSENTHSFWTRASFAEIAKISAAPVAAPARPTYKKTDKRCEQKKQNHHHTSYIRSYKR